MVDDQRPASQSTAPGFTTFLEFGGVALTLLGLFSYSTLAQLYESFYRTLGVSPADVGIGYAVVLARSFGLLAIAAGAGIGIVVAAWWQFRGSELSEKAAQHLAFGCIGLLMVVYTAAVAALGDWSHDRAEGVRQGKPTQPFSMRGILPLLDIHAEKAVLKPVGESSLPVPSTDKLMYLGASGDLHVLYNVTTQRTLRIPVSGVLVITER
ncbi:hypothetical protein [Streptomyces canus]|uniref:hypothetical protein n=1 Tax=Streptomyces canus TaxID=58343 RepID=UPI003CEC395F